MKKIILNIFCLLPLCTLLSGCLEDRPPLAQASLAAPSSYFDGVTAVQNLGGFPIAIQVSWHPTPLAVKYRIYGVIQNPTTSLLSFNLIAEVTDPNQSTYIQRDATAILAGTLYTYKVNAVDALGVEDPNVVEKSTVAFEGIGRVDILSSTSARIIVNTAGSFNRLIVLAQPTRLPSTDLSQTASQTFNSSQSTINLNNLKPGTTYSFSVLAQIDDAGDTDGNQVGIKQQTPSDSFGSGNPNEGPNVYQYRSVKLVQAFGDSPHVLNSTTLPGGAPPELDETANPSKAVVKIIPNPFSISNSGKFRVIRVGGLVNSIPPLVAFDTTTATVCAAPVGSPHPASATATACVVCDHSMTKNVSNGDCDLAIGTTPPTFIDKALDPPPRKYYYTITKVTDYTSSNSTIHWPEELPLQNYADFTFAAHVPDSYMALVQRDSVNYDMCKLLNQPSDPRNSNHCAYKGIAATPYTTAGIKVSIPNSDGFYDFGYNIFVDRYALSCNWTRPVGSSTPCGRKEGCFSLGGQVGSYFKSDIASSPFTTPDPASNLFIPSVNITVNDTYASNPLGLFSLQFQGNNCYAAYFSQAALSGNPGATSTPITGASWTSVGRLADLAVSMDDNTQAQTKAQIGKIVRAIATNDPGPLGSTFSDRKRPALTGLSNTQAQALCGLQTSAYGTKRLMRRREYVATTPLPSSGGEPGFSTVSNMNNIANGTLGQTAYVWNAATLGKSDGSYGDGTEAGIGQNPGGCAVANSGRTRVSTNPGYCYVVGNPAAT